MDNLTLSKLIAEGKRKTVVGTLKGEKLGRFIVEEINFHKGEYKNYQVDFNKIISLILENCRYTLNTTEELGCDTQECLYEENQWFSKSLYFKVTQIRDTDVQVEDHEGKQYTLPRKFVECECQSADHFKDTKKMDSTQIKRILQQSQGIISKITYKELRNAEEIYQILENPKEGGQGKEKEKNLRKWISKLRVKDRSVFLCQVEEVDMAMEQSLV